MNGIRAEQRTAMMALVRVCWEDQTGTPHDSSARMEDRSPSGACIRLRTPIALGSKLRIDSLREHFQGIARYCRKDGVEYVLGIQKDADNASALPIAIDSSPPHPAAKPPIASPSPVVKLRTAQAITAASSTVTLAPGSRSPTVPLHVSNRAPTVTSVPARVQQPIDRIALQGALLPPQAPSAAKVRIDMPTKWFSQSSKGQKRDLPEDKSSAAPLAAGGAAKDVLAEKTASDIARSGIAGLQGDLLSMDDVYRAAGILSPRMGYSITKVADMLSSAHLTGVSDDMKRASVLMALDAAGIPIEDVLHDAAARQEAVDAYEAKQQKQFEEFWAQKDEENALIQAEMDRATAMYLDRIKNNLDEVAREKITFATWQTMKLQESQRIAEAVLVCTPSSFSESTNASLVPLKGLAAGGKQ
jgi:hypothetical protein